MSGTGHTSCEAWVFSCGRPWPAPARASSDFRLLNPNQRCNRPLEGQREASGIVNLKPLLPTTAICTGSRRRRVMANWMQAQSPIHLWLMCIHQARGGEQNPAGKTQVVKGLLQRGTAASTARQLEQVKQDTPQHELAHYQSDPAGSQAPHCLLLAVSCGCELPFHHQLSIPHSLWITPALIPLWFRSQSWYKTSNKPGWWPCTKIRVDIEQVGCPQITKKNLTTDEKRMMHM